MSRSRREFLLCSSVGLLSAAIPPRAAQAFDEQSSNEQAQVPPPGAPPAFGTAPPVGPEVSSRTFVEAGKLVQIQMTAADQAMAAGNWRMQMAPVYERRMGPRKISLEPTLPPATQWNPVLPELSAEKAASTRSRAGADAWIRSAGTDAPLPVHEDDIAFASVAQLARWIEQRKITAQRLTEIYLRRLERFDPQIHCVITLTRAHALEQARQADAEITAGRYRGPLHGIPWGAKDLLDTANIPTTYGAEPYRDRVPTADSVVVERLHAAGAVLVAKLSLGGLALNDVWFGG